MCICIYIVISQTPQTCLFLSLPHSISASILGRLTLFHAQILENSISLLLSLPQNLWNHVKCTLTENSCQGVQKRPSWGMSRGALWGWRGQHVVLQRWGSLSLWAQEIQENLPVMLALRLFQAFFKAASGKLESGDWGSLLLVSCRRACEQNWGHPMHCSKVTGDTDHSGKSGARCFEYGVHCWGSFLNSPQACKLWDYTHFKNDWEPQKSFALHGLCPPIFIILGMKTDNTKVYVFLIHVT